MVQQHLGLHLRPRLILQTTESVCFFLITDFMYKRSKKRQWYSGRKEKIEDTESNTVKAQTTVRFIFCVFCVGDRKWQQGTWDPDSDVMSVCVRGYLPDKSCHWWGSFLNKMKRGSMPSCSVCMCELPSASMAPWDSRARSKSYPALQIKYPSLPSKENKQSRLPATNDNHHTSSTRGGTHKYSHVDITSMWNKFYLFYRFSSCVYLV